MGENPTRQEIKDLRESLKQLEIPIWGAFIVEERAIRYHSFQKPQ